MKNRLLLVMLGAATGFAAAGRCADVPTNVWVGASGGAFETASNWSNPSLVTDGAAFFAVFTNETTGTGSPFEVTTSTTPVVYGISYAPPTRADDATNVLKIGGFTCRRHESFGNAARLDVGAGACLSIGSKIAAESSAPVEKVGAGTIQFGADEASFVSLRVSEGVVEPTAKMALAGSEIATQGTGLFRLACDAVVRDVRPADGTSARSVDLNGHALSLGGYSGARAASVDTFTGAGTLALQNGAALDVTAPQSADVDLVVRNADLGLKGRIFGCYTFNDPDAPWANATGHADLVPGANGAPTIQKDATRGYVAYFDGTTSLVGPGTDGALDYMPRGGFGRALCDKEGFSMPGSLKLASNRGAPPQHNSVILRTPCFAEGTSVNAAATATYICDNTKK